MTSTIITKNSSTASSVPSSGSLTQGELAVNVTDKKLYTKDSGGTVVKLVGSLGNQEASAAAITGGSINGTTVGASTASTGAFTTLSASSTVSGTGFSTYLASPPAIGGTAAAAGSFTTLSASGAVTLSGGTANGVAYLNGSKVVTSGSALTFNGTTFIAPVVQASDANATVKADGNGVGGIRMYANSSGTALLETTTDSDLIFRRNSTEGMRLTSTGLGIGTSSPTAKLYVNANNSTATAIFQDENNGAKIRLLANSINFDLGNNGTNAYLAVSGATSLAFNTNSTERLRLDGSGNLGLGVTPSVWGSVWKAQQFQVGGFIASQTNANDIIHVGTNAFANSSNAWTYINTAASTRYQQYQGAHSWYTAPSGTAGNSITFTQAMTLDASGQLGIGTTSPGNKLDVRGGVNFWGASSGIVQFDGTSIKQVDNTVLTVGTFYNQAFTLITNNTERARIDTSGRFAINVAGNSYSQDAGLTVNGTGFTRAIYTNINGTSSATHCSFANGNGVVGSITTSGTTTTYATSSDYRLKNTVAPMTGALAKVALLKPVTYKWNADGSNGEGFIAHELAEVCPDAVVGEKDAVDAEGNPKYQGIDTSFLVATLTAAIQELKAEFDAYKASHP